MTAQGGDILAWLETAITKAEADADRWHDAECSFHETTLIDVTVLQGGATLCDCEGPASVRRRCAADRKMLALHNTPGTVFPDAAYMGDNRWCVGCGYGNDGEPLTQEVNDCPTLRALAEGYGWTEGER